MRLFVLAALVAALPAAAQAPADTTLLVPGDGALVTDWVAPGQTSYVLRLTAPMQQDVGTAQETVTVDGGVVTRVQTVSIPMQGTTQTDSVRADATTLVPMTHHSTGGQQEASLEFMAEGVVGMLTPREGEATAVTLLTDAPVFDTAWAGEIARSLPFAEGAVFKAAAFAGQSPEAAVDLVYTVTGREEVGGATAWVVEAQMGPVTMTHLVDAGTRALVETRFSPQPGVSLVIVPAE